MTVFWQGRILNTPIMIDQNLGMVPLAVLAPKLGIDGVHLPDGATCHLRAPQMGPIAEQKMRQNVRGRAFDFVEEFGLAYIEVEGELAHRERGLKPYSGIQGYDGLIAQFDAAMSDSAVKAILFDVDSPGGEVAGAFEAADRIYRARGTKPIFAIADSTMASAAYLLGSAADQIFMSPTGQVGSIGVIALHLDFSEQLANAGVKPTLIYAGERKADGNPLEPLPKDTQARLQGRIDKLYGQFVEVVARNRNIPAQRIFDTKSDIFDGPDAKRIGLVDEVEMPDVVERAILTELKAAA